MLTFREEIYFFGKGILIMKQLVFVILIQAFVFISFPILSSELDCLDKITDQGRQNSTILSFDLDKIDIRNYGKDHLASAIQVARTFVKYFGCNRKDINFRRRPDGISSRSRCYYMVPDREYSLICYVESTLGYFFVNWDMQTQVNITYTRWD